jgi:hypothetical protein
MYTDKQPGNAIQRAQIDPSRMAAAGAVVGTGQLTPMPEVPREMARLGGSIDFAEKSLSELVQRLDGMVMRPSEPEQPPSTVGIMNAAPSLTGHGQELNSFVYRVDTLAARLQDVLRRLEL